VQWEQALALATEIASEEASLPEAKRGPDIAWPSGFANIGINARLLQEIRFGHLACTEGSEKGAPVNLYFVRHGESVANLTREFANAGASTHPLTSRGIAQAQLLADTLASHRIAWIYSSPLLRAVRTADILSQTLQAPVVGTEALREWSVGIFEGTSDERGWLLHRRVQEDWFVRGRLESKIPGGESFIEIRKRFVPFIDALAAHGHDTDERVALVGHGGLYTAILPTVLSNISYDFAFHEPFPHTAYALGETHADGLRCLEWCGIPLQGGAGAVQADRRDHTRLDRLPNPPSSRE
jgi:broad specificity phosphatase PhoE